MKKTVHTALLSAVLGTSLGACSGGPFQYQESSITVPPVHHAISQDASPSLSSTPSKHSDPGPKSQGAADDDDDYQTGAHSPREAAAALVKVAPFSRDAVLKRMISPEGEGYSEAVAVKAIDSLHVNWNEQARKAALSYLEFTNFTCQGLKDQLSQTYSDAFTQKEADWGAEHTRVCHVAKGK